jgi:biotin synthase
MCLTIPGKIKSINGGLAVVENGNKRREEINIELIPDAKTGDWVLYATKLAIHKINAGEAKEIIDLLEEKYPKVDTDKLPERFKKIIVDLKTNKKELTKDDITYLLSLTDSDTLETLYAEANTLRKDKLEDFVCIHGIVEFSNYCRNNCLYCGIRKESKIKRYRMTKQEIVEAVGAAVEKEGYKLIVLQSGEDSSYSNDDLLEIIKEVKSLYKVFIFISVGERSKEFYKKARITGASGSLFRFESSSETLYNKLHPNHSMKERLESLNEQIKNKYYMASGGLIGLPGQTEADLANDLLLVKELGIPMLSAGPYLKAEGTPLAMEKEDKKDKLRLTLNYIAVARLLIPEIKIPVTTALETLDNENGRHRGLLAGANALMFNITPAKYREDYGIYDHKHIEREKVWQKYGLFKGEESWEMIEDKLNIS